MALMDTIFETYFANADADESENDDVVIRYKGKLLRKPKEEIEALYDAGEEFSVVIMDDDGEPQEFPM